MSPTSIADILRLVTREPGRPRLTWYGDGGERVELSGAVLENWVNKTANFLFEEFDAGPGTRVLIDLPPHWRTAVWALATWRVGASVQLVGPTNSSPEVVVTSRPDAHAGAGAVVAVALPALARRFPGDLPRGAVDAASAVMTYGDALGWVPGNTPSDDALFTTGRPLTHAGLLADAVARSVPPGARMLLTAAGYTPQAAEELVLATLAVLAVDGSVVGVAASEAARLTRDPLGRDHLVTSERITVP